MKVVAGALVSAAKAIPATPSSPVQECVCHLMGDLVGIMYVPASRPLHKQILAAWAQLHPFREWLDTMTQLMLAALKGACADKTNPIDVVGPVVSLQTFRHNGPSKAAGAEVGALFDHCAAQLALTLCNAVVSTIKSSEDGTALVPVVVDACQEALSSTYYLIQNHPKSFVRRSRDAHMNGAACEHGEVEADTSDDSDAHQSGHDCDRQIQGEGRVEWLAPELHAIVGCLAATLDNSIQCLGRDASVAAGVGLASIMRIACSDASVLAQELALALNLLPEGLRLSNQVDSSLSTLSQLCSESVDLQSVLTGLSSFGKLCVIRGCLVALPKMVINVLFSVEDDLIRRTYQWSLLYDSILPTLCRECHVGVDGHYKYHAVTALFIGMQQVKASMEGKVTERAIAAASATLMTESYDPFPRRTEELILDVVWSNWEDPLVPTVKQVQGIFTLLMDVCHMSSDAGDRDAALFFEDVAVKLLKVGSHRKGKYALLKSLVARVGAQRMWELYPNLLHSILDAFEDDSICYAACTFLKAFLSALRTDLARRCPQGSHEEWLRLWMPYLLKGMLSENDHLRANANQHALELTLKIDPSCLELVVRAMLVGSGLKQSTGKDEEVNSYAASLTVVKASSPEQRVAAVIACVKLGRAMGLVGADLETVILEGSNGKQGLGVPRVLFENAVTHLEESIRIDALELVCCHSKSTALPTTLELSLLRHALPLNMRCTASSFRNKWTSVFRKFLARCRASVDKINVQKQAQERPDGKMRYGRVGKGAVATTDPKHTEKDLLVVNEFLDWLIGYLFNSVYPCAPYTRKFMAMQLLQIVLEVWPPPSGHGIGLLDSSILKGFYRPKASVTSEDRDTEEPSLSAYRLLVSPKGVDVFLGVLVDSWDVLREKAFTLLVQLPTPLPGYGTPESLVPILEWALQLMRSPRVREGDAGALILRLIFHKYTTELGWVISLHPEVSVSSQCTSPEHASVLFVHSLLDMVASEVRLAKHSGVESVCEHAFAHGPLLALRYVFLQVDYRIVRSIDGRERWRNCIARVLKEFVAVAGLAFDVVSSSTIPIDDEDVDGDDGLAPSSQILTVSCWLSMKEVALALGILTRRAPLQLVEPTEVSGVGNGVEAQSLLTFEQLTSIGEYFMNVLLRMKHRGAIEKTQIGFESLCERLLASESACLRGLPDSWQAEVFEYMRRPGQDQDDVLRRSAGIPYILKSLFRAEPGACAKQLLPKGVAMLVEMASDTIADGEDMGSGTSISAIPRVHAFNTLRALFSDTNLVRSISLLCDSRTHLLA
eukprot:scaffold412_cov388-Prasinococcus_capsulatus_cf.AAC.22